VALKDLEPRAVSEGGAERMREVLLWASLIAQKYHYSLLNWVSSFCLDADDIAQFSLPLRVEFLENSISFSSLSGPGL
jgi:hypothetical protein